MWRIAVLYALFAVLLIAVNIGTQTAFIAVYGEPGAVPLSILAGTATGLVAKYVLDTRRIFGHVSRDRKHEARTFTLYTAMGWRPRRCSGASSWPSTCCSPAMRCANWAV